MALDQWTQDDIIEFLKEELTLEVETDRDNYGEGSSSLVFKLEIAGETITETRVSL